MAAFAVSLLFALTLFVSATLLFVVQPLMGRLLLPTMGGSPVVWNTCLIFFQSALLFGYLYAHLLGGGVGNRRGRWVHLLLLPLPLLVLPIHIPGEGPPPGVEAAPVGWLLGMLIIAAGLPFFLVASTAPLLQRWFAGTGFWVARDPYFLYAASNLGSMLALLAYPFLIEPWLDLDAQARYWQRGYLALIGLIALCALTVRQDLIGSTAIESQPRPLGLRRRLYWIALAFVPSSLLMGVTSFLTTDLAAMPLLWVVPLALYLLTFILVFSIGLRMPARRLSRVLAMAVVVWTITILVRAAEPLWLVIALHLGAFFVAAWFCHGLLAEDRPPPEQLTEFYLWMSFGGVLGGLFNGLLAPILFRQVGLIEYPLAMLLACLFRSVCMPTKGVRVLDVVIPLLLGGLTLGLIWAIQSNPSVKQGLQQLADRLWIPAEILRHAITFAIPAVLVYTLVDRPLRFTLGVAAIVAAGTYDTALLGRTIFLERNYLGVVRVTEDPAGKFHRMVHGNTIHGQQRTGVEPALLSRYLLPLGAGQPLGLVLQWPVCQQRLWRDPFEPLSYYHRTGPVGSVFAELISTRPSVRRIGVIGLGTGSMAWYGRPGQDWTFFELDPIVIRLAQNRRYFTFLRNSRATNLMIERGDARVRLGEMPDHSFDLLVLDAFSSDAIPLHLLTAEALALYRQKLTPQGILLFNISNRYLDLEPILARLAENDSADWQVHVGDDLVVSDQLKKQGKFPSLWLIMAHKSDDLAPLLRDLRWRGVFVPADTPVWTDNFANVWSALKDMSGE